MVLGLLRPMGPRSVEESELGLGTEVPTDHASSLQVKPLLPAHTPAWVEARAVGSLW